MPQVKVQLQGYVPAFSDASVKLTNEATGAAVERRVFLDGSLTLGDMQAGSYELEVKHPNLIMPIDRRRIRIFPQPAPTYVPITLDPVNFTDNPIRQLPVADLSPVQQASSSVQDRVGRVGGKAQGDSIRASDWNTMVSAISDLAGAVLDLTRRVAPVGHAHPEIADKIEEVQDNVRKLSDAFGRSLLELQRQLELDILRKQLGDTFDAAGVPASDPGRTQTVGKLDELQGMLQTDPRVFTKKLADTSHVILATVGQLASQQGAKASEFLARPGVKTAQALAHEYSTTGTVDSADSEIRLYRRTTAVTGAKKLLGGA